jgi:hypothetical protein
MPALFWKRTREESMRQIRHRFRLWNLDAGCYMKGPAGRQCFTREEAEDVATDLRARGYSVRVDEDAP